LKKASAGRGDPTVKEFLSPKEKDQKTKRTFCQLIKGKKYNLDSAPASKENIP